MDYNSYMENELEAKLWKKFYKKNIYYHKDLENLAKILIPHDASVLEIDCKGGELLSSLPNKVRYGISYNNSLAKKAKKKIGSKFIFENLEKLGGNKFDYILISGYFSETPDVQVFIKKLERHCHEDTRIIVTYFNFFWKPILDAGEKLGLKLPQTTEPNWLSEQDIDNFFYLESWEKIKSGKRFILPYEADIFSAFVNKYISPLPLI